MLGGLPSMLAATIILGLVHVLLAGGASALPPPQTFQLPALALVRAVIGYGAHQCGQSSLFRVPGAALGTDSGFAITGLGRRGRTAPVRQGQYFHLDAALPERHGDPLTDAQRMGGLHTLAVNLHLAAGHGVRGQRAGLEKTHMPQPLVDAVAVGG